MKASDYLVSNHPPLYNAVESPEWKAFLARASLKCVLRVLAGMAKSHEASQRAIAEKTLPVLHRLEQVSSVDCIGSLAENVIESLKENADVAAQVCLQAIPWKVSFRSKQFDWKLDRRSVRWQWPSGRSNSRRWA